MWHIRLRKIEMSGIQGAVMMGRQSHLEAAIEGVGVEARPPLSVDICTRLMKAEVEDIQGVLGAGVAAGGGTTRPAVTAATKMITGDGGVRRC